jgi:hypothetical protein
MRLFTLFLGLFLTSLMSFAEPGVFKSPYTQMPNRAAKKAVQRPALRQEFDNARGLSVDEAQSLYIQAVACGRHVYTPSGLALNGDGTLKVTKVTPGLYEVEFPSHLFFGETNPYGATHVLEVETDSPRKLVNLQNWKEGASLQIAKTATVTFFEESRATKTVLATDEFRVIPETYPKTFVVRETIYADKKIAVYYICQ